jgi:Methyltransferase domain
VSIMNQISAATLHSARMRMLHARRFVAHGLARRVDRFMRRLWVENPLATSPRADIDTYRSLFEAARNASYPTVDQFEEDMGVAIDRQFIDELAFHTQVVIKKSRLVWTHGRVLYSALRNYLEHTAPFDPTERITVLETGTARGFSAICAAKALSDVGRAGVCMTLDILPHTHPIYWNCIDDADGPKTRAQLLEPWKELVDRYVLFLWGESATILPAISVGRIHFAFVDAAHNYETVMFEFGHISPKQQPGDVIMFDDVTPTQFSGVVEAVDEICSTRGYARTDVASYEGRKYVIARKQ